jgi:hypothetical protein
VSSLVFLTACNANNTLSFEQTGSVYQQQSGNFNSAHQVSPYSAIVSFAGANLRPLSVSQKLYKNGLQQRIELPNSTSFKGNNFIEARLIEKVKGRTINERISLHNNNQRELSVAFADQFPGKRFRVVSQVLRNRYGPYGMAVVAVSKKVRCAFAWQRIDTQPSKQTILFNNTTGKPTENLSYNMRYCAPRLTVAKAEQLMAQVSIQSGQPSVQDYNVSSYNSEPYNYDQGQAAIALPSVEPETKVEKRKPRKTVRKKKLNRKVRVTRSYSDYPTVPLPE